MPKTHDFTENSSGETITIVLNQIQTIEKDHHSDCTTIVLIGGKEIGVSESVDEVKKVVESA